MNVDKRWVKPDYDLLLVTSWHIAGRTIRGITLCGIPAGYTWLHYSTLGHSEPNPDQQCETCIAALARMRFETV